ncbi:hypothetical protein EYC84_003691 [Monilinia fructicola]|uniref:Uncharacterized protein n=1 Tax=Monilinia fructicola TaxID=38448 RepID=A0A5M9JZP6_MONFR|nr:hypothetical protein EYC84_003691 [Monilinia fructicola]
MQSVQYSRDSNPSFQIGRDILLLCDPKSALKRTPLTKRATTQYHLQAHWIYFISFGVLLGRKDSENHTNGKEPARLDRVHA